MLFGPEESGTNLPFPPLSSSGEENVFVAPFLVRNKLLRENGFACVSCPLPCTAPPHNPYPPPREIPIELADVTSRELRVASVSTPACVFRVFCMSCCCYIRPYIDAIIGSVVKIEANSSAPDLLYEKNYSGPPCQRVFPPLIGLLLHTRERKCVPVPVLQCHTVIREKLHSVSTFGR